MRKTFRTLTLFMFLPLLLSCCSCFNSKVAVAGGEDSVKVVEGEGRSAKWSTLEKVGYPKIPDSIASQILERYCYTTSHNKRSRQPNWVMWRLDANHVMKRKEGVWSDYREDPELDAEDRATLADYASSGYDRGHMCPGGDCNWDDVGRDETFVLSNMCPQHPQLNRGDWKEIEMACRLWAEEYGSIYIVCGPIFFKSQAHETIGPNQIPVPEAFFKVVLCPDPKRPRGIGFICRNTEGNRKKDFYVNTIRQVERVTGYKFFPKVSDSIKKAAFDMDDINAW
ncbi:MAG: DNA/RNA non-specific endonuclease [Prevotella sp.]|nr:DNA/RNA non-specific endonuclease [Prevotella sp.]